MADILPTRPDPPSEEDKEPRVVGLDSDEVSDLLSAISSETARTMLSALHDEPATPSELADRVDTSIQNAQYHLGKLEDADLIEPGGTAYSEKGREMTVYTPADRALVVVAGGEDDTSGLQSVLAQLLGGLGVVALGSVVVERLTRAGAGPDVSLAETGGDGGAAGGAANATAATATAEPTATAAETAAPTAEPTATPEPAATPTETDGGGGFNIAEATETATPQATGTEAAGDATVTESARTVTESARTVTESAATATPMETATETPQATGTPTAEPTVTAASEATRTATEAVRTTAETTVASGGDPGLMSLAALSPGELFFLGGVVTLAFTTAYWWLRS
jgi:DNA-binding transcriptional ArsR family regulator